jgi:hypothetical protein
MNVKLWCTDCGRTWPAEAQESPGEGVCPVCGGGLRPDRRGTSDRRGRLQRMWDPEPRTGVDRRRRSLPGAPA